MSDEKILAVLNQLREKVRRHREAYSTDVFPDYSFSEGAKPSIDQVAGKMGRHMCEVFLHYIDEVEKEQE